MQFSKAEKSTWVIFGSISIFWSWEHFLKAKLPISFSEGRKITYFNVLKIISLRHYISKRGIQKYHEVDFQIVYINSKDKV